jgi:hypothetical protein
MFHTSEILKALLYYIILISISLFLGFLLERVALKKEVLNIRKNGISLFWRLFTGTLLLISLYAIFVTKGQTIFFICPILIFFLVRQKLSTTAVADRQQLFFFICSAALNFLFYWWALESFTADKVTFVSGDFNIYFRTAQYFNEFGIENASLDPIYRARFANPYHYGDIWMYALVSRFVSINPSVVYLISFAQFSVIFINGMYQYIQNLFEPYLANKKHYLNILLFAGLFAGLNAFFPKFILPSADPYTLSVMNWSKVLLPSYVLIALLILIQNKNWLAVAFVAQFLCHFFFFLLLLR